MCKPWAILRPAIRLPKKPEKSSFSSRNALASVLFQPLESDITATPQISRKAPKSQGFVAFTSVSDRRPGSALTKSLLEVSGRQLIFSPALITCCEKQQIFDGGYSHSQDFWSKDRSISLRNTCRFFSQHRG